MLLMFVVPVLLSLSVLVSSFKRERRKKMDRPLDLTLFLAPLDKMVFETYRDLLDHVDRVLLLNAKFFPKKFEAADIVDVLERLNFVQLTRECKFLVRLT